MILGFSSPSTAFCVIFFALFETFEVEVNFLVEKKFEVEVNFLVEKKFEVEVNFSVEKKFEVEVKRELRPTLETLDYTIRIGSTLTFLYFDLYLYSLPTQHTTFNNI